MLNVAKTALALALALVPAMAAAATLCTPQETAVFSCGNGAKLLSICATRNISKTQGTMQYRFGTAGKIELVFPAVPHSPATDFSGGTVAYSGSGAAFLRFSNGAYEYTVFSGIGKWGPNESPAELSGLYIRKQGKNFSQFVCRHDSRNNHNRNNDSKNSDLIGPDFFDAVGIAHDDGNPDFEIPGSFFKH